MFRTPHRLFSSSLRSSARANLNAATRSPRAALTRRMMSSESHAGHGSTSNDRPWIIGSALVFGPLVVYATYARILYLTHLTYKFLYLVSPSARGGSHGHTDYSHQSHRGGREVEHVQPDKSQREEDVKPIADDEGTQVSGKEVKESMEKAFEADSPKDAQKREGVAEKAEMTIAEDNSATEARPDSESLTDATSTSEAEPNATPVAPVAVDETATVTNDEQAQGTAGATSAHAPESKLEVTAEA